MTSAATQNINPLAETPHTRRGFLKSRGFFTPLGVFKTSSATKRFYQLAGSDELIDVKEWKQALASNNSLMTKRLFELVDTDNSGFIDLDEYLAFVNCLMDTKTDRRFQLVFAIYDQDNDGQLKFKDIQQLLAASLDEQSLNVNSEDLSELAKGFLRYFEGARKRKLDIDEFILGIKDLPKINQLFEQFVSLWINDKVSTRNEKRFLKVSSWIRYIHYLKFHLPIHYWSFAYIVCNLFLFHYTANIYADQGARTSLQVAHGFGACLNLNAALMLILMAKWFWSVLRHSFIARLVPIDSLTDFHRRVGWVILILSLGHIAAHSYHYWKTQADPLSLITDRYFLTGVILSLVFTFILIGVAFRNGRKREYFSASHLLYAVFLVFTLLHGQNFWIWLAAPLTIYFIDVLIRSLFKSRKVKILAIEAMSDGVTKIRFAKPKHFRFHPGDFIYLRIAVLSSYQWHPFTLSAAPQADYFDLHIRNNGNWSGALHNLARKSNIDLNSLAANIDGPYGAPTTHISKAKIAVMVAAGIGVTPFASALESLVFKTSNQNASEGESQTPQQTLYFHWLNRSQASYEWFQNLLIQAEEVLKDQFKLYIYLTSFNHNLTNIAMQIAVEEFYSAHGRDPFTQLHAITKPGRPNWSLVFSELLANHPNERIQIYYCGPQELGDDLQHHCYKFGFEFYRERFD